MALGPRKSPQTVPELRGGIPVPLLPAEQVPGASARVPLHSPVGSGCGRDRLGQKLLWAWAPHCLRNHLLSGVRPPLPPQPRGDCEEPPGRGTGLL